MDIIFREGAEKSVYTKLSPLGFMCLHDTPCYRCTVTRSVLHHQLALKITCRVGLHDNSQVKMLVVKPDSLIPGTHIVEADSRLLWFAL